MVRKPDYLGTHGEGWDVPIDLVKWPAALYCGLIYAPQAHPFWQYHTLHVVHLRPLPGQPPAKKRSPSMEYELAVLANNPEKPRPDPDNAVGSFFYLEPPDLVEQFNGVTDEQAARIGRACVRACMDGTLIPDSDFRSVWSVTLYRTLQHIREGHHS